MDRGLRLTQIVIGVLCVAIVAALFLFGMVGGGAPADQQPTTAPSDQGPREVAEGERMPGELARSLDEIDTFDVDGELSPDRQSDYEAAGDPQVEFPESPGGLREFAEQPVDWESCGDTALCATILAPLDWDDPEAAAVEIAVLKVPSQNPTSGPLFVNPGGPGAGGTDFALSFPADHWTGYDIVGWDPRGTGRSTHVVCGTLQETDAVMDLDATPDDANEDRALREGHRDFAQQCRDNSGALLDHVSSVDVARDMDLLRHLLGADKLNFFGVSYGTYIGAMYAELFPDTSGRLVLDGAVEITDEESVHQIEGFERAFRNWADWCAGQEVCVLTGGTSEEIQQDISDWIDSLDESPLSVGARELTQTHAATGIAMFLYGDESVYRALAMTVQEAMRGDGATLLAAADQLNARSGGAYDTLAYAFPAMHCVDWPDRGMDAVTEQADEVLARAPMLGRHLGIGYTCEQWTVEPAPPYRLTAEGADPILVVGSTGDSATPYEQAERMAAQLEPAVLLTYDGPGHGAVTGGNECVADVVGRYLADGTLPPEGTRCS